MVKRVREDDDGDYDMCRSPSPKAKRSKFHVCGDRAMVGVLTHVAVDISKVPSPLAFFDRVSAAVCYRRKYQTTRGSHFLLGSLSTCPKHESVDSVGGPDAVLIVMGSCERLDYVAHLGLLMRGGLIRITQAWAQSICAIPLELGEDNSDGEDATAASPLARFVHDVTGRRLHLACALTHCNMSPPSSTRVLPMLRLGSLANKMALEDAVRISRVRRGAAIVIQRAYRSSSQQSSSIGTKLLGDMFAEMRVDDVSWLGDAMS